MLLAAFGSTIFVCAVCYADDVALLAPSPSGLRIMLKTCINFADQHHLSFNADKTQLIKFYKSPNPVSALYSLVKLFLSVTQSVILATS